MANAMLEDEFKSSHGDLSTLSSAAQQHHRTDHLHSTQQHPSSSALAQSSTATKPTGTLTTSRSVNFAILPPPKRFKSNVPWTAKQVVDALSTSVTASERFEALHMARRTFDHHLQSLHDEEMATGVDAALTKHLTFLLFHHNHHNNNIVNGNNNNVAGETEQMAHTCDALEMVFRASSRVVGRSFDRMGSELMRMLVMVIDEQVQRCCSSTQDESPAAAARNNDSHGNLMLRQATKVLGHLARVGQATRPLAHCPGLLASLIRLVQVPRVPWEARLSALWIVANLACNAENMQFMVCTPDLVSALVQVASRPLVTTNESLETIMEVLRSRSIAARAILNLSWAPETKVTLAANTPLLDLLTDLSVHRSEAAPLLRSHTVRDILTTTRRYATGALRNLASAPRRTKAALCAYRNGRLLDVLTDAALNDTHEQVRDRAFATIHNLATTDTARAMVSHPALVIALKDVLLTSPSDNNNSDGRAATAASGARTKDNNDASHEHADGTPREHASATLMVLERTITREMSCYENLRELLDAVHNPHASSNKNNDGNHAECDDPNDESHPSLSNATPV